MKAIFSEAESFQADISGWSTSSVTDMSDAFFRAHSFGGNIGSWDVSNVVDFEQIFAETYLAGADLSGWKTSSAQNMNVSLLRLSAWYRSGPFSSCFLIIQHPCDSTGHVLSFDFRRRAHWFRDIGCHGYGIHVSTMISTAPHRNVVRQGRQLTYIFHYCFAKPSTGFTVLLSAATSRSLMSVKSLTSVTWYVY